MSYLTKSFLTSLVAAAVVCGSVATSARAQLLSDQFNGSIIDSTIWQTSMSASSSSITESGGYAIFQNRGRLITRNNYATNVTVTGRFKITGASTEEFKVVIRTDGTFLSAPGESANGFIVRFRNASAASSADNEVSIYESQGTAFAGWTGTLNTNTDYDFKITDDGSTMAVFFQDMTTPKVQLVSSKVSGNKIVIYNREQIGSIQHQTQLDYFQIVANSILSATIYTAVEIAWNSTSGKSYQVQWTEDLATGTWTDYGSAIAGSGTEISVFDTTRNRVKRFYRIVELN